MSVMFSYPWNAPTSFVELRDPQLDDAFDLDTKVAVKTMMDGSIRTYRFTPAKKRRELEFIGITRSKTLSLIAFLIASQGKLIKFVDFDNSTYRGYITTDPEDIKTVARGLGRESRPEDVRFNIVFEGILL